MLIYEMLKATANRLPDKIALICDDEALTYGELQRQVLSLATNFQKMGVQKGDRVALLFPNCIEMAVSYFACAAIGAIAVPLNNRLTGKDLVYIINDCGAGVLAVGYQFWDVSQAIGPDLLLVKEFIYAGPERKTGALFFDDLLRADASPNFPDLAPEDVATIMYTSGTTGLPKGAMMTHRNIFTNARNCGAMLTYTEKDITLIVVPLFHVTGLNSQLVAFTYLGGTCVIMKAYKTAEMIQAIERHKITVLFNVPTMYVLMLINETLKDTDISSLRMAAYGGAPMDKETILALKERLGLELFNAYGLTESSSLTTVLPACDAVRKAPSVGLPVPGVQVRTVDGEGRSVPAGEAGELLIKGHNIVRGYFNQPDATRKSIVDGWLHTGDVARIDDEGYVFIVDRMKDMIVRGGENIYSIEVESVLNSHPRVLESAVVPEPHHIFGEVVRACLVLRPEMEATAEEILEYCRQHLADFKMPARVLFLSALPRNPGGKVIKTQLRELPVGAENFL
jgi:acyl-CoA synthetase (AMP-forming)/AMP-acid ligase II